VGGTYYLHRTLRQLDLEALLGRLLEAARTARAAGEEIGRLPAMRSDLDERLLEEELRARLEALRRAIEAEIRRRLVADRGAEALARSVRSPLPEDIEFMHATREELALIRRSLPASPASSPAGCSGAGATADRVRSTSGDVRRSSPMAGAARDEVPPS